MYYDPTLVLDLLHAIEAKPEKTIPLRELDLTGYQADEMQAHLRLLLEAELVLGRLQFGPPAGPQVLISRLSLKGHLFHGLSRDRARWQKFVALAETGGGRITRESFQRALKLSLPEPFTAPHRNGPRKLPLRRRRRQVPPEQPAGRPRKRTASYADKSNLDGD